MPKAPLQKDFFQLNAGLNTESNEVSFPDGFTVDEGNYELLIDGSRRRRKGLQQESGGSAKTVATLDNVERSQAYLWKAVDGNPSLNYWVHKIGEVLYFHDDDDTPSSTWLTPTVNLDSYNLGTSVANEALDFTTLNGDLFVSGRYLPPLKIEWTGSNFNVTPGDIRIRDYDTIDEGTPLNYHPPSAGTPAALGDADLTDDHWYNLANRGWKASDLLAYADGESEWPSLVQQWYRGYRRQVDASFADLDGIKTFDSAKLAAEDVGLSSAPTGALYIDVFDDTVGISDSAVDVSSLQSDTTPTISTAADPWVVTLDETSHPWSPGDVIQVAFYSLIEYTKSGGGTDTILIGPTVTVNTTPTADTWTYAVDEPSDWDGSTPPLHTVMWWYQTRNLTRSTGTGPLTVGPRAIEAHDGRMFYAGIPDGTWSDHIFFSQLANTNEKVNKCYVEADPTDPNINQIVDTDGGYIVIPDIGNVNRCLSTRNGLLVFSDQGVWEVSGNQGFFSPLSYRVRKITDAECIAPDSPVLVDSAVMYASSNGIYAIAPNQYTGLLEATNIIEGTIQTAWNRIGPWFKPYVKFCYDGEDRKLYVLHGGTGNLRSLNPPSTYEDSTTTRGKERVQYTTMLILDLRLNAWYKYEFRSAENEAIINAWVMENRDAGSSADELTRFKVLVKQSTTSVEISDFNQTDYLDFDGSESPTPFMLTAWDNIGDFQRRRSAPVITVYAKRTETGYTSTGNGFDPVNESSNLLTAYWDWTDDSVSGKIGSQQETYRRPRHFVPSATDDVDGYPVVVSRNKLRGRGRVLQLRFDGAATKDSHLLGFSVNYKVSRRV